MGGGSCRKTAAGVPPETQGGVGDAGWMPWCQWLHHLHSPCCCLVLLQPPSQAYRNTVSIPRHWSQKRKYLQVRG